MKQIVILGVAAAVLAGAGTAIADRYPELNPNLHFHPTKDNFAHVSGGARTSNLTYHGGPVIHSAHVVPIFWGPSWGTGGADSATATHVIQFFGQFGTNSHYAIITQYSDGAGAIQTTNLGNVNYFDSSTPPTNVTDADMQAEVLKAIGALGSFDASAIYEVFIPPSSYSSSGNATSCGGPALTFCAYHGHFTSGTNDVKYASMPYPSCAGCQSSGFTDAQNLDHFSCHETREAVTDEDLNAWFDRRGNEADDKCAWSPAPFIDNGFGYQYEWSNAVSGCVR
jgi:hypothetical protein